LKKTSLNEHIKKVIAENGPIVAVKVLASQLKQANKHHGSNMII
jgi:hypothetical protein